MYKLLKRHKDLIIILTIFMLVLVLMVLISITFAYFKASKNISGDITLGELDYTINVSNISQTLLLPGDNIDVNVSIQNKVDNKTNLIPFYFRFKILNGESDYNLNLISLNFSSDYILNNSYYYYKYKLNAGDSAKILNNIMVDSDLKQEDVQTLNLSILVDAVQSEHGAYKEVFTDAPQEWIEFIENN